MNECVYDMAIIGGGPGGYTAALYGARAGLSVLLLEKLSAGGQMATTAHIENYPGFPEGADGFELGEQMRAQAEQFGVQSVFEEVTRLSLAGEIKQIHTSAQSYAARTVIVATGAEPRPLGLPREEALRGRGVSYCATCDGMFYRGKTVAVVGGGNSAAEEALHLAKTSERVYLIHRRDAMRAERRSVEALERAGNVTFIWNTVAQDFRTEGTPSKVTGLELRHLPDGREETLACDGVFVAIGRNPNTALVADQLELDDLGYILADETTRTSLPGVFAVGDVRTKPLRQIITAAADGAVAVQAALYHLESLPEPQPDTSSEPEIPVPV